MIGIMGKLRTVEQNGDERAINFAFFCPGCQEYHGFRTTGEHAWEFDGNMDSPTVTPSILVRGIHNPPGEPEDWPKDEHGDYLTDANGILIDAQPYVCHLFIRRGRIMYARDTTHNLVGQMVDMQEEQQDEE